MFHSLHPERYLRRKIPDTDGKELSPTVNRIVVIHCTAPLGKAKNKGRK
jgi:hypothetical protein